MELSLLHIDLYSYSVTVLYKGGIANQTLPKLNMFGWTYMITINNGVISIQANDVYLDTNESELIDRLMNSKYLIYTNSNLYTYDGLLMSGITLTDDGAGNYIISSGNVTITIPQTNVLQKDYDESKLIALCDLFTTIATSGINIDTDTYTVDPLNNTITLKPLNASYTIVGDIPKLIVDYVDYIKSDKGLSDIEAQQYIIDTELANLSNLKDQLDNTVRQIFSLYIQLAKYKSTP